MNEPMLNTAAVFLGIETSCDETAAAVVRRDADGQGLILSNIVRGQSDAHAAYGGVVPEIAARAHVSALDGIIEQAMKDSELTFHDLDGVAATAGPGLIGGLLVGLMTAKSIAAAASLPLFAVNHLEGHALTATLTNGAKFPYLLLLASGGHTQLLLVRGVGRYQRLGTTIDDSSGEAFDKVAKMLQLGQPGGPEVERMAKVGNRSRFALPRPLSGKGGCDFSFSGLKTAVRQAALNSAPLTDQDVADICASFQAAVADSFCEKTRSAMRQLVDEEVPITALVVAGGVASNQPVRDRLASLADQEGVDFLAPPPALCTDNGAMIAWAGLCRFALELKDGSEASARSRWPLDDRAEPKVGFGRQGVRV